MLHVTASIERENGVCPACGQKTLLVIAPTEWRVDTEGQDDQGDKNDAYEIPIEITGHYCPTCERLTSLSMNG